ncbi:transporter associated domain-containing protein [Defluviitalea phaphyphila]|uniref:transporter associated domain-containing protein n=1 Tax=Defluviitalea phaphyphila TaxID=1473580 RepID=UPI0007300C96|nr:transporter associated domain-containing protein [Defluviitalea phaphyphila]
MLKQRLRNRVSTFSSYTEIFISVIILVGIIILSVPLMQEVFYMVRSIYNNDGVLSAEDFLSQALQLIIGVEFVKMLAKHTPGSAVDVLLFAVARKLITSHGGMLDLLLGVLAIAILFAIKKYLSSYEYKTSDGVVVNGGTNILDINNKMGLNIPTKLGHTVAGIIVNYAEEQKEKIKPGYQVELDDLKLEVYSMDEELIKQVKIMKKK